MLHIREERRRRISLISFPQNYFFPPNTYLGLWKRGTESNDRAGKRGKRAKKKEEEE
jgi:hypothetical protein